MNFKTPTCPLIPFPMCFRFTYLGGICHLLPSITSVRNMFIRFEWKYYCSLFINKSSDLLSIYDDNARMSSPISLYTSQRERVCERARTHTALVAFHLMSELEKTDTTTFFFSISAESKATFDYFRAGVMENWHWVSKMNGNVDIEGFSLCQRSSNWLDY